MATSTCISMWSYQSKLPYPFSLVLVFSYWRLFECCPSIRALSVTFGGSVMKLGRSCLSKEGVCALIFHEHGDLYEKGEREFECAHITVMLHRERCLTKRLTCTLLEALGLVYHLKHFAWTVQEAHKPAAGTSGRAFQRIWRTGRGSGKRGKSCKRLRSYCALRQQKSKILGCGSNK
jgi:hypothetical protein